MKANTTDRFDKIDSSLERISVTMIDRVEKVDLALESKADSDDMRKILEILDSMSKWQEISDDERLVMGHQLDRLDKWTHQLADKIGHRLSDYN